MTNWRPTAARDMLVARADLNQQIRDFFRERQVLEVETPLLASTIGTDPALDPISASYQAWPQAPAQQYYLQTSPEFAMKRLLAANSGAVFQLCKAFRNGESGQKHNPEFSMLEWYRPGFSLTALMDEVEALVAAVLGSPLSCRRISYAGLFQAYLDLEITADLAHLQQVLSSHIELDEAVSDADTCLELLYSHVIEPQLQDAVMIYDYPASQAALARTGQDAEGRQVARRFELVIRGMELANGYDELTDAREQERRFAADLQTRAARNLPVVTEDRMLVAALEHGMPDSAGVALGVDRLLMLKTGAASINEVLNFPFQYV